MKKNILFLILILTSLLIITGCGKNKVEEDTGDKQEAVVTRLGDLKYTEPFGYREITNNLDNVNYQSKRYKFFDYSIQVTYRKNKNINDLKPNMNKKEIYEVNGYKFRFIEDGGGGTTFDSYYIQYNKDAYILDFYGNKTEDNFKVMEQLMNSIEFVKEENK